MIYLNVANPSPPLNYGLINPYNIIPIMVSILGIFILIRFIYRIHFSKSSYSYREFKSHMDQIIMFYPEIWKRYVREEINEVS